MSTEQQTVALTQEQIAAAAQDWFAQTHGMRVWVEAVAATPRGWLATLNEAEGAEVGPLDRWHLTLDDAGHVLMLAAL